MHLALANEVLGDRRLPPDAQRLLLQEQGPFLLGNTAPDVQTVSGQSRVETHFYTLPRTADTPAHEALLARYPELGHPDLLPASQAAFVAGYIAHLAVDEIWLDCIFLPHFKDGVEPWAERAFQHNVLRTWMDRQDLHRLDSALTAAVLKQARPHGWLPFVSDRALQDWRDWLVSQLKPGRRAQTAEVFAERMGVSAAEMEAVVDSPQQMAERVFRRVPESILRAFREASYNESIVRITHYLQFCSEQEIAQ